MSEKRITNNMSVEDALIAMARGIDSDGINPGSFEVLVLLLTKEGLPSILHMDEIGVHGHKINILAMYVCDGDLLRMLVLLEASRFGVAGVTGERIRKAIEDVLSLREHEEFDFAAIQDEIRRHAAATT